MNRIGLMIAMTLCLNADATDASGGAAVMDAPVDNVPTNPEQAAAPAPSEVATGTPTGTTAEVKPTEVELVPVGDIERNNVKATFYCNEFKRGDAKKAGKTYPYPNKLVDGSFNDLVTFIGEANAKEILAARLALMCQNWSNEALPTAEVKTPNPTKPGHFILEDKPTGAPMVWDDFANYVKSFSARGESMATLLERQNKLTLELPKINATTPEGMAKLTEAIQTLASLAQAINSKKRKSSEEDGE